MKTNKWRLSIRVLPGMVVLAGVAGCAKGRVAAQSASMAIGPALQAAVEPQGDAHAHG
ncbi:MAG: hypothetical protein WCI11_13960 [Candidatus Methylumidiphilus sp.]